MNHKPIKLTSQFLSPNEEFDDYLKKRWEPKWPTDKGLEKHNIQLQRYYDPFLNQFPAYRNCFLLHLKIGLFREDL